MSNDLTYGLRIWKRSNGTEIYWKDMNASHLQAVIAKLRREADKAERIIQQMSWQAQIDLYNEQVMKPHIMASEMEVYLKTRNAKAEQETTRPVWFQDPQRGRAFAPTIKHYDYGRTFGLTEGSKSTWGYRVDASFGCRKWQSAEGRIFFWKDMDARHLMNCVKLIQRRNPHDADLLRYADAMHRYCAWREKAHA